MADVIEPRERGLAAYARRAWVDAHEALSLADRAPLEPDDLERLATAAYMLGRDEEYVAALERAHHGDLDRATRCGPRAARSGSAMNLALAGRGGRARRAGSAGPGGSSSARAATASSGAILLLARMFEHAAAGDHDAAIAAAPRGGRDRASASATPTCSPSPRRTRASC